MDCPQGTVRSGNEQERSLLSGAMVWPGVCSTDLIGMGRRSLPGLPPVSSVSCFISTAASPPASA